MNFTIQKLLLLIVAVLLLVAAEIHADDTVAGSRQALSNRELAAAGLAISVTVRGGEECGIDANSESDEKRKRMRDLFGRDAPFGSSKPSQASGVVLTEDGEILSLSVAESCSSYLVTLPDRREVTAQPVGFDSVTDLALLRVDTPNLTHARIGDASALRPGDRVLAVGSPFGMEGTLSEGLVSSTTRDLPNFPNSYYIQSDAMINPGSAGGPLLNEYGEVIGVHALLFTRSGRFDGMSFALPIDMAMRLVEDLREFGHVRRAWLGVSVENSDAGETGAVVTDIEPDGPVAGVAKVGDRIVALDGQPVATTDELRRRIDMHRAGDDVSVTLVRGDSTVDLALTLAERPERGSSHE